MSNQDHVDVYELNLEKKRWVIVDKILRDFCTKSNISFINRIDSEKLNACPGDKILATWMFDLVPSVEQFTEFNKLCGEQGKKVYIIVDHWLDNDKFQYPNVKTYALPKLLSLSYLDGTLKSNNLSRSKLYNAFIHRSESIRQSWFYFLHLNDLLDNGYVSYNLYQINSDKTGTDLFDNIHKILHQVPHFDKAYRELRSKVPFRNFNDKVNLERYVLDSKYSLVLDTYAPEDDQGGYYISEKVTRALQYPTVNLLFLQKGTIGKILSSGFVLNEGVVDFDNLEWIQRQQRILEILTNDVIALDNKILYDQANHNRDLMKKWLTDCISGNVFKYIFDELHNA